MKSAYVKPTMNFEIFRANEHIGACYNATCIGTIDWVSANNPENNGTHNCPLGTNGGDYSVTFRPDIAKGTSIGNTVTIPGNGREWNGNIWAAIGAFLWANPLENWDAAVTAFWDTLAGDQTKATAYRDQYSEHIMSSTTTANMNVSY